MSDGYDFTSDWFSHLADIWREVLRTYPPSRILEIGAYEGRSACFVIEACAAQRPIELHCVDTWTGGVEHDPDAMPAVEQRFDANIARACAAAAHPVSFHKHKMTSTAAMVGLLAAGAAQHFELIYIDGSHQAPDVLTDAVLAFQLLRVGGILIFDDYLWSHEGPGQQDFYNMPKPAVDAFVNIFQRRMTVIGAPLRQLYVRKIAP